MATEKRELSLALLRQQNDASAVFRLPVELICHISALVISETRGSEEFSLLDTPRWNRFHIGQICHRWRAVVIECPSLWSVLDVDNAEALEELLRRSKTIPLHVYVNISCQYLATLVPAELHRIQKLSCSGNGPAMRVFLESLVNVSAPILEHFEINSTDPIPDGIFAGRTPRLRELSLCRTPDVDWHSPLFHNLEKFMGEEIIFKIPSGASDVFDMISAFAPTIQTLQLLSDLSPPLPSRHSVTHPAPPFNQVELPNLTALHLLGDINAASYFLSHIISTQPVEFEGSFDINTVDQLNIILPWLSRTMDFHLEKDPDGVESIFLSDEYMENYLHYELTSSGPDIMVAFMIEEEDEDSAEEIMDAVQIAFYVAIPLPHVKSLTFSVGPIEREGWFYAYGSMKEVESVEIHYKDSYQFFFTLLTNINGCEDCRHHDYDGEWVIGEIVMPKLDEILISSINMDHPTLEEHPFEGLSFGEAIVQCMHYRKQVGYPVKKFTMQKCQNVTKDMLRLLREDVELVEWDGVDGEDSDSEDSHQPEENLQPLL